MKTLNIFIIYIFYSFSIIGQSLEEAAIITFEDCNCNEAENINIDTLSLTFNKIQLKISCILTDKKRRIVYYGESNTNDIIRNGIYYSHSLRDSTQYYSAIYKSNHLERFACNYHNLLTNDKIIETYSTNANVLHGPYLMYRNDKLSQSGHFKNGVRDSLWITYHPNMEIQSQGSYIGKKITIALDTKTHQLIEILNKTDTLSINPLSEYSKLINRYNYDGKGGVQLPIYIDFKRGIWKYYNEKGKLIKQEIYDENGILIE